MENIHTQLCSHHHSLIPELLQTETLYPCLLPQSPSTTNLLSVSADFSVLVILHECTHIACDLLCLASFTEHHVSEALPCCNMSLSFSRLRFHCTDRPPFAYPLLSVKGHLGCFHPFAMMSNAATKTQSRVLCGHFILLGVCLRMELLAHMGTGNCF